jgi:hypothetical protein
MPTTNITVNKTTWTKVADSSNSELLMSWDYPTPMEVAVTATNAVPTVIGHKIASESAITRALLGSGFVWMKQAPNNGNPAELTVVVTK